MGPLDLLLVCLGGGGLPGRLGAGAEACRPAATVVGVEPEAGNDGQRSFRSGEIVHIAVPQTIADGAQTQHLGQLTFPIIRRLVSDIVTVPDAALVEAMRFFAERMRIVVEPTGCLAAAAAFSGAVDMSRQARRRDRQRRQCRHGADECAAGVKPVERSEIDHIVI